jgi:hypothetical protein
MGTSQGADTPYGTGSTEGFSNMGHMQESVQPNMHMQDLQQPTVVMALFTEAQELGLVFSRHFNVEKAKNVTQIKPGSQASRKQDLCEIFDSSGEPLYPHMQLSLAKVNNVSVVDYICDTALKMIQQAGRPLLLEFWFHPSVMPDVHNNSAENMHHTDSMASSTQPYYDPYIQLELWWNANFPAGIENQNVDKAALLSLASQLGMSQVELGSWINAKWAGSQSPISLQTVAPHPHSVQPVEPTRRPPQGGRKANESQEQMEKRLQRNAIARKNRALRAQKQKIQLQQEQQQPGLAVPSNLQVPADAPKKPSAPAPALAPAKLPGTAPRDAPSTTSILDQLSTSRGLVEPAAVEKTSAGAAAAGAGASAAAAPNLYGPRAMGLDTAPERMGPPQGKAWQDGRGKTRKMCAKCGTVAGSYRSIYCSKPGCGNMFILARQAEGEKPAPASAPAPGAQNLEAKRQSDLHVTAAKSKAEDSRTAAAAAEAAVEKVRQAHAKAKRKAEDARRAVAKVAEQLAKETKEAGQKEAEAKRKAEDDRRVAAKAAAERKEAAQKETEMAVAKEAEQLAKERKESEQKAEDDRRAVAKVAGEVTTKPLQISPSAAMYLQPQAAMGQGNRQSLLDEETDKKNAQIAAPHAAGRVTLEALPQGVATGTSTEDSRSSAERGRSQDDRGGRRSRSPDRDRQRESSGCNRSSSRSPDRGVDQHISKKRDGDGDHDRRKRDRSSHEDDSKRHRDA